MQVIENAKEILIDHEVKFYNDEHFHAACYYLDKHFQRQQDQIILLKAALRYIRDKSIPDQPATDGASDLFWVIKQYAAIRMVALKVLEGDKDYV